MSFDIFNMVESIFNVVERVEKGFPSQLNKTHCPTGTGSGQGSVSTRLAWRLDGGRSTAAGRVTRPSHETFRRVRLAAGVRIPLPTCGSWPGRLCDDDRLEAGADGVGSAGGNSRRRRTACINEFPLVRTAHESMQSSNTIAATSLYMAMATGEMPTRLVTNRLLPQNHSRG
jgi:hypothetical protein